MAHRAKVVIDVNVVVSALFGGTPARAVEQAVEQTLLLSSPIEAEMRAVTQELARKVSSQQLREFRRHLREIFQRAVRVEIPGRLRICRDPADDIYLETCQVGRAHFLVTGDPDLLSVAPEVLKSHKLGRLEIVTPAAFLERLET